MLRSLFILEVLSSVFKSMSPPFTIFALLDFEVILCSIFRISSTKFLIDSECFEAILIVTFFLCHIFIPENSCCSFRYNISNYRLILFLKQMALPPTLCSFLAYQLQRLYLFILTNSMLSSVKLCSFIRIELGLLT